MLCIYPLPPAQTNDKPGTSIGFSSTTGHQAADLGIAASEFVEGRSFTPIGVGHESFTLLEGGTTPSAVPRQEAG
jgi:hypothetical protein